MSSERTDIKMFVCGDTGVGKSRFVARWTKPKETFMDKGPTVATDVALRSISDKDKNYRIKIWDLAGGISYRNILHMYQRGAKIALFVFDISNKQGLENLEPMLIEAKTHLDSGTALILMGNKQDEGPEISMSDISEFMKKHAIKEYFLSSAKTGFSLTEFDNCIFRIVTGVSVKTVSDKSLRIQELASKIATLKTLYKENPNRSGAKNILNIVKILEKGINAPFPQQYFNNHLPDLKKDLAGLRWTWRSILHMVLDVILTVFVALTVVGLPLLYCMGLWKPNGHYNGVMSSFRFCTFGDKQKMQQLCEDVFVEKDVKGCQFG